MVGTVEQVTGTGPDQQFVNKVKQFLDVYGWTAVALAKSTGQSAATISQFLNGVYPGNVDLVKQKITRVMIRETEKTQLNRSKKVFIETSISKRYFDVARAAHLAQEVGVVYGDAGLGKTVAGREYASENPDVIFIEVDPGYTVRYFLHRLHIKLGMTPSEKSNPWLLDACIDKLAESGRMLIIDEAEQLPYHVLETIRRIYDKANVGILLAGMRKLLNNLRGAKDQYQQLFSRVGMAARLEPLTERDTRIIVARTIPNADDVVAIFHTECAGNTRRLYKIMARATLISQMNECEIDTEVVQKASELVKIERMN